MRRVRPSGALRIVLLGMITAGAWAPIPVRAQEELLQELKTVASVRLEGRHKVGERAVRSVMKTRKPSIWPWRERPRLRLDFLRSDVASIEALYRHYGFLRSRIEYRVASTRRSDEVEVTFLIDEGPRSRVSRIEFEGVRSYAEPELRRKLRARVGQPFDPAFVQLDTLRISALYQERGMMPSVAAFFENDSLDRVTVHYHVEEGPVFRIGRVQLVPPPESSVPAGYRVSPRLVERELVLEPGEVYRLSRAVRSQERLYETGLFSQVQISQTPEPATANMDFLVAVRLRRPRWVDAGIGSGTNERFRLTAEWGHRNLLGRGMSGVLASRLTFYGTGLFQLWHTEASLVEPWLFRTRTRGEVKPFYQIHDDRADPRWVVGQRFLGIDFQVRRELNRFTKLSLTQKNVMVHQDLTILNTSIPPDVRDSVERTVVSDYRTHRLVLDVVRDRRDDIFFTSRGSAQLVSAEVAGGPLQGSSSFHKYLFASSWFTPWGRGPVLATRIRTGLVQPFGEQGAFSPDRLVDPEVNRVPLEDRFRIGGVNSIRGYRENSIPGSGGLFGLEGNVELRIPTGVRVPLMGLLGVEMYVDAGNVWARPEYVTWSQFRPAISRVPLGPNDVRYVLGLGPRVNTPIGPVRLDFTWGLRPAVGGPQYGRMVTQFAIGPTF